MEKVMEFRMPTPNDTTPVPLVKKLAGIFLLIIGFLLAATGLATSYNGLTYVGVFLLLAGLSLLIIKIVLRNNP